jgi:hypothetical protein
MFSALFLIQIRFASWIRIRSLSPPPPQCGSESSMLERDSSMRFPSLSHKISCRCPLNWCQRASIASIDQAKKNLHHNHEKVMNFGNVFVRKKNRAFIIKYSSVPVHIV